MQILIGDSNSKRIRDFCKKYGFGRMITNRFVKLYPGEKWAFDNGAYGLYQNGLEIGPYDTQGGEGIGNYLIRLNKAVTYSETYGKPYFAVLPDIVAGGDRSLDVSLSWIGKLPDWSWYLAVQDGMTVAKVIEIVNKVDGIFLGGTSEYKKYAGYWRKVAHHHRIKFHYARCGTLSRLTHAAIIKADSIDTSYPVYEKSRIHSFIQELSQNHLDFFKIFAPHPERGDGHLVEFDGTG